MQNKPKLDRRRAIGLLALFGMVLPGFFNEAIAQPLAKNQGLMLRDETRVGHWKVDITQAKSFTVVKGDKTVTYTADEVMDALLGEGRFGD